MLGRRTYQNNFSSNSVVTVVVEKTADQEVFTIPLNTEIPANTTMTIDLLNYISGNHGTFLLSLGEANGTSYRGVVFDGRIEMDTKSTVDPSLGSMNANGSYVTVAANGSPQVLRLALLQFPQ